MNIFHLILLRFFLNSNSHFDINFFVWICQSWFVSIIYVTFIGLQKFGNYACKPCSWIHTDIMDDNIYMKPSLVCSTPAGNNEGSTMLDNGLLSNHEVKSWCPSHILDFSDLSIGQYFCFPTSKKFVSNLYWNVVIILHHNFLSTFII